MIFGEIYAPCEKIKKSWVYINNFCLLLPSYIFPKVLNEFAEKSNVITAKEGEFDKIVSPF